MRSRADRDDRAEAVSSKIVVTRDDINRQGDTTLSDILGRGPGVTVTGASFRGGEVRMRGLGAGYVAIFINGDPAPQSFTLDSLSPVLIERIEVNRSPTAERGAQAIAGSINIVLKQGARAGQRDVKLTAGRQSDEASLAVSGQYGDRWDDKSWGLAAELRHDGSRYNSDTTRRWTDPQGQVVRDLRVAVPVLVRVDTVSLTPRLNWFITDADTLFLEGLGSYEWLRADRHDDYRPVLGAPPSYPHVGVRQSSDTLNLRLRATWERRLDAGAKMETRLGGSTSRLDQLVRHTHKDAQAEPQLIRYIDGPLKDTTANLNGKYTWPLGDRHVLSAGWDAERTERRNGRIQTEQWPTHAGTPMDIDERFRAYVNRRAAFVQDEWTIRPGWSTYGGLRWETIETGGGTDGVAGQDFKQRVGVLSPILAP